MQGIIMRLFFILTLLLNIINHSSYGQNNVSISNEVKKLQVLVNQGDVNAQADLGWLYRIGKGVPQDFNKAFELLSKAYKGGSHRAEGALGLLYEHGQGVDQDYKMAAKLFLQSAKKGEPKTQHNIGEFYERGIGVDQSYSEAFKWFQQAAIQGHAKGQISLASFYEKGLSVSQDYKTAYMWYLIALPSGKEITKEKVKVLKNIFTNQELISLHDRAQSCIETNYKKCK